MIMQKKSPQKKKSVRPYRKLRLYKSLRRNTNRVGGPNTATVSMSTSALPINENTMNTIRVNGLDLLGTGIGRQIDVAKNYALYRISKVVLKFTPIFDTYLPGATVPGSSPAVVPYLYWKMNRYGDMPFLTPNIADYFTQLGAKPIRFDDKSITVAYKPNALISTGANGGLGNTIKMTPWISTDSAIQNGVWNYSTLQHWGLNFCVVGAASGTGTGTVGYLTATVYYQFKNPLTLNTQAVSGTQQPIDILQNPPEDTVKMSLQPQV